MKIEHIKYFSLFLLFLFFNQKIRGKEKNTVLLKYNDLSNNTAKLDYLYKLSIDPIYKSNTENQKKLRTEIIKIKPANEEEQAVINLIKGHTIYFEDSVPKIKQYFLNAYHVLKKVPSGKYYALSLDALGTLYFELGNKDSTQYYRELALKQTLQTKAGLAEAYFNLGDQNYYFSNLPDAIINLKKSVEAGIRTKDYEHTALAFKFLSLIYRDQKTFDYMVLCDSSLSFAYKTNDNVQITEALYYKMQCLILLNKQKDAFNILNLIEDYNKKESSNLLLTINFNKAAAFYYSETGDVKKTIFYLQKNHVLTGSISRKSGKTGRGYNNLGNACIDDKQYELAVKYLDTAIWLGQKYNDQTLLWFAYDNMVRAYRQLNDYKNEAIYFRKLWDINDTILKIENQGKIAEFETRLNLERKNTSIKNLNVEKSLNQATISNYKKTQIIYYIIAIMMLFILFTTILFFRQKNKTQKILAQQSNEITRLQTQMNPHFIFNALTSLQSFVLKDDKHKAVSSITQLAKLMRMTLMNSEKEFITVDQELEYLNMYIAFENQRNNENINFITNIAEEIETDNPCIPPMLIQPLIENAIKHAFTNNIITRQIKLSMALMQFHEQKFLKIIVEDNGVGFETKDNTSHQSKAMAICKQRIDNLSPKNKSDYPENFVIKNLNTEMETGTQITLTIPYL
ncbi:MAG: histidine kinase [Bacteroidota bacterium]|nr:histidine kinase [Bacteroidota bacterium]